MAAICWPIWKTRNRTCFDGKPMNNHVEIISLACALMGFWAGLQSDGDKEMLINGVNAMLKIALRLLAKSPHAAIKTRFAWGCE